MMRFKLVDSDDRLRYVPQKQTYHHLVMLLCPGSMAFDVPVEVLDNLIQRFSRYNLSGANKTFLGFDLTIEFYSLRFFEKNLRAGKNIRVFPGLCTPANTPSTKSFYISQ